MKKYFGLILIAMFALLVTGCGKDDSWNGVYKNDSNNEILIYTKDNKTASIMVREKGENYEFFPIQYENSLAVGETTLTSVLGEKIVITKDGMNITITLDGEENVVWEKIVGTYTKEKNAKRYNANQF